MSIAILLLVFAVVILSVWCARLDSQLGKVLERERQRLELEAERLRRSGL